jgi:tripartite tricarboxylate transporter TctB family protein
VSILLERCLLIVLALIGVSAIFIGMQYSDGTAHGGHLLPSISGGAVALLAVTTLFDRKVEKTVNGLAWKPWFFLGITALFLLAMPVLGYPLVAPVWMVGLMLLLGLRQPVFLVLIGCALPAIAWLLLEKLAHAPPPLGLLGEIL